MNVLLRSLPPLVCFYASLLKLKKKIKINWWDEICASLFLFWLSCLINFCDFFFLLSLAPPPPEADRFNRFNISSKISKFPCFLILNWGQPQRRAITSGVKRPSPCERNRSPHHKAPHWLEVKKRPCPTLRSGHISHVLRGVEPVRGVAALQSEGQAGTPTHRKSHEDVGARIPSLVPKPESNFCRWKWNSKRKHCR